MLFPQKKLVIEPFWARDLLHVAIKKVCNLISRKCSKRSLSLSLRLQNLHKNPYKKFLPSARSLLESRDSRGRRFGSVH